MTDIAEDKEFQKLVDSINKRWGEGSLITLDTKPREVPVISTGILPLDVALDVGGLPRGRIIEIYGQESSGKSTICQHVVAEAQKLGEKCAYVDMEHALDITWAEICGVDIHKLLLSQPSSGEEALEITEALVRSGKVSVVIVDSVAALVPQKELEGDMGDAVMGSQARLMSQAMRKLSGAVAKSNTLLIFTNQIRQKLGVMYGPNETTTGGNALKFYASVRMDVRKSGSIKEGENQVGNDVTVRIVKNKVGRPFMKAKFSIVYGKGVDKLGTILELGVEAELVDKRGAFYYYLGEKLGQGKAQAVTFLENNPTTCDHLEKAVRQEAYKLNLKDVGEEENSEE